MATEKSDVMIVGAGKLAQPLLVPPPGLIVHRHHPLIKAQSGGTVALRLAHLIPVKPGVAAVQ